MKNFSIQSFTLMMMMMTISSAASQNHTGFTPEELLKQIHNEANKLMTNMSSELKKTSVKFPKGDLTTCWKEFFCFAEKSLESMSLAKLTGLVEGYNKKIKNVTCTAVRTHQTRLYILVEKIQFCSKMKLN